MRCQPLKTGASFCDLARNGQQAMSGEVSCAMMWILEALLCHASSLLSQWLGQTSRDPLVVWRARQLVRSSQTPRRPPTQLLHQPLLKSLVPRPASAKMPARPQQQLLHRCAGQACCLIKMPSASSASQFDLDLQNEL